MNRLTIDEIAKLLIKHHSDVVKGAELTYDNISSSWRHEGKVDFRTDGKCGCPLDLTASLIFGDDFAYIYSAHIDGRRKRRYYYDHYDNTEEMVAYMMDYYRISLKKYHKPYKHIRNLAKKWSIAKILDDVYEHEEGKIIATF